MVPLMSPSNQEIRPSHCVERESTHTTEGQRISGKLVSQHLPLIPYGFSSLFWTETMAPDETSCLDSVCQAEKTLTNRTRHSTAQTHSFPPGRFLAGLGFWIKWMAHHDSISPHHFFSSKSGSLRQPGPRKSGPPSSPVHREPEVYWMATSKVIDCMSCFPASRGEETKWKQKQASHWDNTALRLHSEHVQSFSLRAGMGTDSVLLVQHVWPHLNCLFLYFSSLVSWGQPWETAGRDKEKKLVWTATERRFCEFLHSQTLKPWNELTSWSFGFLLRSGPDRDKYWAEVLTSESMTNVKEESSLQNFVVFLIAFNLTVGCIDWWLVGCVSMCGGQRTNFGSPFFSSTIYVVGIKLGFSGLVAGTLTCWVILLAPKPPISSQVCE